MSPVKVMLNFAHSSTVIPAHWFALAILRRLISLGVSACDGYSRIGCIGELLSVPITTTVAVRNGLRGNCPRTKPGTYLGFFGNGVPNTMSPFLL